MAKTSHFDVQDAGLFKTSEYCLFAYNAYTKIKNQSVTDDSSIVTALAVYCEFIVKLNNIDINMMNEHLNIIPIETIMNTMENICLKYVTTDADNILSELSILWHSMQKIIKILSNKHLANGNLHKLLDLIEGHNQLLISFPERIFYKKIKYNAKYELALQWIDTSLNGISLFERINQQGTIWANQIQTLQPEIMLKLHLNLAIIELFCNSNPTLDIQRVRHFKIQLTNLQVNDVPEKFQKIVSLFHKAVQLGFAISRDTAQTHKSSLNPVINHFLSQFNNFDDLIKGNTSANNEVRLEAPRVPKPDISTVSIAGTWNRPTQTLEKNTNTTKKLM